MKYIPFPTGAAVLAVMLWPAMVEGAGGITRVTEVKVPGAGGKTIFVHETIQFVGSDPPTASYEMGVTHANDCALSFIICAMLNVADKQKMRHDPAIGMSKQGGTWKCADIAKPMRSPSSHFGCTPISLLARGMRRLNGDAGWIANVIPKQKVQFCLKAGDTLTKDDKYTSYVDILKACPIDPGCAVVKGKCNAWLVPDTTVGTEDVASVWVTGTGVLALADPPGRTRGVAWPAGNWFTMADLVNTFPAVIEGTLTGFPAGTPFTLTFLHQAPVHFQAGPDGRVHFSAPFLIPPADDAETVEPSVTLDWLPVRPVAEGTVAQLRATVVSGTNPPPPYTAAGEFMYQVSGNFIQDSAPPIISNVTLRVVGPDSLAVAVEAGDELTVADVALASHGALEELLAPEVQWVALGQDPLDLSPTRYKFSGALSPVPLDAPVVVVVTDEVGNRSQRVAQYPRALTNRVGAGFASLANNFHRGNHTVAEVLPNVADETVLYKFERGAGTFTLNTFAFGQWERSEETLAPGEGAFLFSPAPQTLVLAGQVVWPSPRNRLPEGRYLVGCPLPQPCPFEELLGFGPVVGDRVHLYNDTTPGLPAQPSSTHTFDLTGWDVPPVLQPGKAAFVDLVAAAPPVVTAQPQSQTVAVGDDVSFSVTAAGSLPLTYQWLFNGAPLADANNRMLTLTRVATNDAGGYQVVVANAAGRVTSAVAVLTVRSEITLTSSAGANGSIAPPGTVVKSVGETQVYTATPNTGYEVDVWELDDQLAQLDGGLFALYDVRDDHDVRVTFRPAMVVTPPRLAVSLAVGQTELLLTATGASNQLVALEVSSNLVDWLAFDARPNTNGIVRFTLPLMTPPQQQFIRAVAHPCQFDFPERLCLHRRADFDTNNLLRWMLPDGRQIVTAVGGRFELFLRHSPDPQIQLIELKSFGAESGPLETNVGAVELRLRDAAVGALVNGRLRLDVMLQAQFPGLAADARFTRDSGHVSSNAQPFAVPAQLDVVFQDAALALARLTLTRAGHDLPFDSGEGDFFCHFQDGKKCKELCLDIKVAEVDDATSGVQPIVDDANIQKWVDKLNETCCSQCCVYFTWSGKAKRWKTHGNDPEGPNEVNVRAAANSFHHASQVLKLHRSQDCYNVYFVYDFEGEQQGEGHTIGQTFADGCILSVHHPRDRRNDDSEGRPRIPVKVNPNSNVMPHELCGHALGLGGGLARDADDLGVDHHHKSSGNLNHATDAGGTNLTEKQCARIRADKKLKETNTPCTCLPNTGGQKDKCPCKR
jgi:hypothetical protein